MIKETILQEQGFSLTDDRPQKYGQGVVPSRKTLERLVRHANAVRNLIVDAAAGETGNKQQVEDLNNIRSACVFT